MLHSTITVEVVNAPLSIYSCTHWYCCLVLYTDYEILILLLSVVVLREKSVCKADHKKHTVTHAELQLLNSSNLHLVSELNKDEFHRAVRRDDDDDDDHDDGCVGDDDDDDDDDRRMTDYISYHPLYLSSIHLPYHPLYHPLYTHTYSSASWINTWRCIMPLVSRPSITWSMTSMHAWVPT